MKKNINLENGDVIDEVEKLREINKSLVKTNDKLRAIASEKIENTKLFQKMEKELQEVHKLKNENIRLKSQIKDLKNTIEEYSRTVQKLVNEKQSLLEKGPQLNNVPNTKHPGGRPIKFDNKTIKEIKAYRKNNKASYKEIALKYNCSIGLIHKLINEK
jgi:predicted RNase H-like nuclease (RuvC/YqgF family)